MSPYPMDRGPQSDLFSNGSGERLAEISRHGGGIPPRFLGDELGADPGAAAAHGVSSGRYSGTGSMPLVQ